MRRPLAFALLLFVAAPALGQGRIAFVATEHAFGTLREGDPARHVFVFRNAGDAPLRLTNVRPSCGCTTPRWPRTPVAPGDTASVAVAYDSEDRPGPFERTIDVDTDGVPEYVTLTIRGEVIPRTLVGGTLQGGFRIARELIFNETVPAGGARAFVFRMQNQSGRAIRLVRVEAPFGVRVEAPEGVVAPDAIVEVVAHVDAAGRRAGDAFDHALVIVTDDAEAPRKTVRVRGTVR